MGNLLTYGVVGGIVFDTKNLVNQTTITLSG